MYINNPRYHFIRGLYAAVCNRTLENPEFHTGLGQDQKTDAGRSVYV